MGKMPNVRYRYPRQNLNHNNEIEDNKLYRISSSVRPLNNQENQTIYIYIYRKALFILHRYVEE